MPAQRPWPRAPKIDEPWGFVFLCGVCRSEPPALLFEGGGILCGLHVFPLENRAIPLKAAAEEAWPDLTTEERFNRVGTAIVVLHALAAGAWYFSREGLQWAWSLWEAADRIDARARG